MSAWRAASPFRAVGIYVGGKNRGCAQPNLTRAWVRAELAAGWRLVPTYVGRQAPGGDYARLIAPSAQQAAMEGTYAATSAVQSVQALGIGPGNPIYNDMEAYTPGPATTPYVLAFLSSWTAALHGYGYLSGVYANASSGIADLVHAAGAGYHLPDDIWIAHWNNVKTVGDPYVPASMWSAHQRIHQYEGDHYATYDNVGMNIDNDWLNGAVVS